MSKTRRGTILGALCLASVPVLAARAPGETFDLQLCQTQTAEVVRRLGVRLAEETASLEKLTALRLQGYASWRECAEQRVAVDRCQAQQRAIEEFARFTAAVAKRIQRDGQGDAPAKAGNEIRTSLLASARRIAAAEAQAGGRLRMAQIAVRRAELLLDSLRQLQARGFASAAEVQAARDELAAAAGLVEQLIARQPPPQESAAWDERLEADFFPVEFLPQSSAVEHLLALRLEQCLEQARGEGVAARLTMLEEISRRLERASHGDTTRRERDFAALDVDYARAELRHASERAAMLRQEEARFVEQVTQPPQAATVVLASSSAEELPLGTWWESPPSAHLVHRGESPYFLNEPLANRLSRLTASEYHPVPSRIWPSLQRPGNAPASSASHTPPLPFSPNVRATYHALDRPPLPPSPYREPAYGDYYQFGNLRPDLPKLEPRATSYGGPWYYPGASTNFRQTN